MLKLAPLPARAVISVEGADRHSFLQGLVSNDVMLAGQGVAVWAALLTPQGKYLADFFILADGDRLLLDCERGQAEMLATKLSRFRLRAKVVVMQTTLSVAAAWDGVPEVAQGLVMAPDPRLADAGWRVLGEVLPDASASEEEYDRHRLLLGLPDGTRDSEPDRTVLLEAGFDELNGISWSKGCFMGQELTARTRYRGLLKRRLVPVSAAIALPPPGTPLMHEGREIGTMRSSRDGIGLAVLRLEHLHGAVETEAGAIQARVPDWMRLPEPKTPASGTPLPGTGASDTGASGSEASEIGASDERASDTGASDTGASGNGASDNRASDSGASGIGASEAGASETGASDAVASGIGISDSRASEIAS